MKHVCIVGCGLYGATAANLLAPRYKVTIIEKRNHIGGNIYDYIDPVTGVLIHKYGPHIIHIDDMAVLTYIKNFTSFNSYRHKVKASYKNELYDFPINLITINKFFNRSFTAAEARMFLGAHAASKKQIINLEEKIISLVGAELYAAFFRDYTTKQWGKEPSELSPAIINRIPVRYNYEDTYYAKRFHGIPTDGYTSLIRKMLAHKNIEVVLDTDYFQLNKSDIGYDILIYTGKIDEFFKYKYGRLQYRSLKFHNETLNIRKFQDVAVINYPQMEYPYTRICEHKHFYPEREAICAQDRTVVSYEIPCAGPEPFYPIMDEANKLLYAKYHKAAEQLSGVYFGGRLGEYRYYDMEDCIKSASALAKRLLYSV